MLMPLHCFNGWRPVLIVCRRKYFGNEVGLKSHFFFLSCVPPFLKGSPGTQAKLTLPSRVGLASLFSPVLNFGGYPTVICFHVLFFLFLGMGWKPRVCTIPVVPILLLS